MLKNSRITIVTVIVLVYVLLTELILPPVKYLPAVGIIIDSLNTLFGEYSLLKHLGEFLASVYLPFILLLLLFYYLRTVIVKLFIDYNRIFEKIDFAWFFPVLFVLLYIALIIENKFIGGMVASLFIVSGLLKYFIAAELKNLDKRYIVAAFGLGLKEESIYKEIIPKQLMPVIKKRLLFIHLILLNIMLIFEFIARANLGGLYFDLFTYQDASGILTLSLFIAVLFGFNHSLVKYALNKSIFWES